uniref:Uncharacterized protein n=1 Tax=Gopherus agassizii TaxID=38772 RepID=A0A452ICZ6_9SAUR
MAIFQSLSTEWRLIQLPLGILCLPLLVTLGILSAQVRYSKLQQPTQGIPQLCILLSV